MSFQEKQQQNWLYDPQKNVQRQAKQIASINDDGTSADEILKVSRFFLYVLLAYSGLLGAMSYYKNFEPSFGHTAALFMCLALAATIEVGKSFFAKWTLRIPFFKGLRHIVRTPHNTFLWVAAMVFTLATFAMSVRNSTKGGEQLARMLRHEREKNPFQANTTELDKQIEQVQTRLNNAPKARWKGKEYYQDAKSVRAGETTLALLQSQRDESVKQQRADWERNEATKADNQSFAASLVMASGGWVELLQLLLLVLCVSCERTLLVRAQERFTASPTPSHRGTSAGTIGFNQQPASNQSTPIGFRYGQQPVSTPAAPLPVSQCDTPVSQARAENQEPTEAAFKHFLTAFQRDAANLYNNNGARETVCKRLGNAALGMLAHFSALSPAQTRKTLEVLKSFHDDVHVPLLAQYPETRRDETPIVGYWDAYSQLYENLTLQLQRL